MSRQVEMISLEKLVSPDHPYHYFKQALKKHLLRVVYLSCHLI
ncbi:hypothetical protein [Nitrosomonas cryotolerans]|nr:hypothetical protein [Nitrosomonas cryotolerans]